MSRRSAFADRLLEFPELVFSDGDEFRRRGAWREFFAQRIGPAFDGNLTFEIGCHDASLLVDVAAKHSKAGFIGIDWKCRALHAAAQRIVEAGPRNVALLHGRAQDVRRFFGDGELNEIWLFHPEPCDRPEEAKNRLFSEPFLRDVGHVLRQGGALMLKTDHGGYHAAAVEVAAMLDAAADFGIAARSSDFWNDERILERTAKRAFAGLAGAYEDRFRRKRKPIYYLELLRRAGAGAERSILDRTGLSP